jgi:sorting nexin-1/2
MDVEESPWADSSQASQQASQPEASASASQSSTPAPSASSSTPRPSRGPRRLVAQPTRLEAVDDPLGPLGAVPEDNGSAQDAPPVPPQKEQMVIRTTMPQPQQQRRPADPHHIDDEENDGPKAPRAPPPVEAAQPSAVRSSNQPSVSIEQAAKPTFQIYVGDPHKVGDLTSSHIVYSVRTKV